MPEIAAKSLHNVEAFRQRYATMRVYCMCVLQVMYPAIERYLKETIEHELKLLTEQ